MAGNKKMVEAITSRDEDFAKWYTDIVKKAELVDYSGVKGCMVIRPYGYAIWELMQADMDRRFEDAIKLSRPYTQEDRDHITHFENAAESISRLMTEIL